MELRTHARAKINLGLWVIRRRPDGFHEIVTVFHRISLHDTIQVEKAESLEVLCKGGPEGADNLVHRAARALSDFTGQALPARIEIEKRIPMGRGLGGGSSDAATTLVALNRIYELGLPADDLIEIGARLGADVPFFLLDCGAALARGKGEKLTPLDSNLRAEVLICDPEFPVSTGWAYTQLETLGAYSSDKVAEDGALRIVRALREGDLEAVAEGLHNDFEEVMFTFKPKMRRVDEDLARMGALGSLLSGSGSAFFGIGRDLRPGKSLGRVLKTGLE
jgi:4-diphosphocytidyl-2-C-methyl-D-erythritol kinase